MLKQWRVLAISIVWLIFGAANLIRAAMVAYIAPAFGGYSLSLPLSFLGVLYGVSGLIFLAAAIVAWRRKSADGAFGLAAAYQAVLWTINLVGHRSTYARSLWPRDALLSLMFLALVAFLAGRKKA